MEYIKWQNVLVEWVNCLKLTDPIAKIGELKNCEFFDKLLIKIVTNSNEEIFTNVNDVTDFLKVTYPSYLLDVESSQPHQDEIEITYVCSLLLHYCSITDHRDEFIKPVCIDLNLTNQTYIKAYLENLQSVNEISRNVLKDIIHNLVKMQLTQSSSNCGSPARLPGTPVNHVSTPLHEFFKTPLKKTQVNTFEMQMKEINRLLTQIDFERFEKADLQEELKMQHEKNKKLEEDVARKRSEISKLRTEILTLESCSASPSVEFHSQQEVKRLRDDIISLEKYVKILHEEQEEIQNDRDKAREKLHKLEEQCSEYQNKLLQSERKQTELMMKNEAYQEDVTYLRERCNELNNIMQELNPKQEESFETDSPCHHNKSTSFVDCETLAQTVVDVQLIDARTENLELNQKVKQFEQDTLQLTDQLAQLNSKLLTITKDNQQLEVSNNQLQEKIQSLEVQLNEQQNISTSVSDENRNLHSNLQTVNTKLCNLETLYETSKKEILSLNLKITENNEQITKSTNELSKYKQNQNLLETENNTLKQNFGNLKNNLKNSLSKFDIKITNTNIEDEPEILMMKLNELIVEFQTNLKQTKDHVNTLISKCEYLGNENETLRSSIIKFENNDVILKNEIEKLQNCLNDAEEKIKHYEDEIIVNYNQLIIDKDARITQLQDQIIVLKTEISDKENTVVKLTGEINLLKNESENTLLEIEKRISFIDNKSFNLYNKLFSLETSLIQLKDLLALKENIIYELKKEKDCLQNETEILQAERSNLQELKMKIEDKFEELSKEHKQVHLEICDKNYYISNLETKNTDLNKKIEILENEIIKKNQLKEELDNIFIEMKQLEAEKDNHIQYLVKEQNDLKEGKENINQTLKMRDDELEMEKKLKETLETDLKSSIQNYKIEINEQLILIEKLQKEVDKFKEATYDMNLEVINFFNAIDDCKDHNLFITSDYTTDCLKENFSNFKTKLSSILSEKCKAVELSNQKLAKYKEEHEEFINKIETGIEAIHGDIKKLKLKSKKSKKNTAKNRGENFEKELQLFDQTITKIMELGCSVTAIIDDKQKSINTINNLQQQLEQFKIDFEEKYTKDQNEASDKITELQTQCDQLQNENQKYKTNIESYRRKLDDAQVALVDVEKLVQNQKLEAEINLSQTKELQDEKYKLNDQIQQMQLEEVKLTNQLIYLKEELHETIEGYQKTCSDQQVLHEKIKIKLEESIKSYNDLQNDHSNTVSKLEETIRKVNDNKIICEDLENTNSLLKLENLEMKNQLESLLTEKNLLSDEINNLKIQIVEFERDVENKSDEKEKLQEKLIEIEKVMMEKCMEFDSKKIEWEKELATLNRKHKDLENEKLSHEKNVLELKTKLEESIESYNDLQNDHSQTISKLEETISTVKITCEDLENTNSLLKLENLEIKNKLESLLTEKNLLSDEINNLKIQIVQFERDVENKSDEKEKLQEKLIEIEKVMMEKCMEFDSKKIEWEKELATLNRKHKDLENEKLSHEKNVLELKTKLEESIESYNDLQNDHSQTISKLEETISTVNDHKITCEDLQNTNSLLKLENLEMKNKLESLLTEKNLLSDEINNLKIQIIQFERDVENKTDEKEKLQKKLSEIEKVMTEKCMEFDSKKIELEKELVTLDRKHKDLGNEKLSHEKNVLELKTKLEESIQSYNDLQNYHSQTVSKLEETISIENVEIKNQVESLLTERNLLSDEINNLKTQIVQFERDVENKTDEKEILQEKLSEIEKVMTEKCIEFDSKKIELEKELITLERKHKDLGNEKLSHEKNVLELKTTLEESIQSYNDLQNDHSQTVSKLEETITKMNDQQIICNDLEKTNSLLKLENLEIKNQFETQMNSLLTKKDLLVNEINDLKTLVVQLEQNTQNKTDEIEKLQKKSVEIEKEMTERSVELDLMKGEWQEELVILDRKYKVLENKKYDLEQIHNDYKIATDQKIAELNEKHVNELRNYEEKIENMNLVLRKAETDISEYETAQKDHEETHLKVLKENKAALDKLNDEKNCLEQSLNKMIADQNDFVIKLKETAAVNEKTFKEVQNINKSLVNSLQIQVDHDIELNDLQHEIEQLKQNIDLIINTKNTMSNKVTALENKIVQNATNYEIQLQDLMKEHTFELNTINQRNQELKQDYDNKFIEKSVSLNEKLDEISELKLEKTKLLNEIDQINKQLINIKKIHHEILESQNNFSKETDEIINESLMKLKTEFQKRIEVLEKERCNEVEFKKNFENLFTAEKNLNTKLKTERNNLIILCFEFYTIIYKIHNLFINNENQNEKHFENISLDEKLKIINSQQQHLNQQYDKIVVIHSDFVTLKNKYDSLLCCDIENNRLKSNISELEQKLSDLKLENTKYQALITEKDMYQQQLIKENNRVKENCEAELKIIKTIEQQKNSDLQNIIKNLEQTIKDSASNNEDLNKQYEECVTKLFKFESDFTNFNEDLVKYKRRISQLQNENKDLMQNYDDLSKKHAKFIDENYQIDKQEITKLRTAYSNTMSDNSKLQLDCSVMRKTVDERNQQLRELSTIKDAYEKLLEDNNKANMELDTMRYKRTRDKEEFTNILGEERTKLSKTNEKIQEVRNEYEERLRKMKEKMVKLYQEEIDKERIKMSSKQQENLQAQDVISQLKSQLWITNSKYVELKKKYEQYCTSGIVPSVSRESISSLRGERQSVRQIDERRISTLPRDARLTSQQVDIVEEQITISRRKQSVNSTATSNEIGGLQMEDEEGELFNNTYLSDLKAGRCITATDGTSKRLTELQYRNSMCPPHLKSSYPAETQFNSPNRFKEDDIKLGAADLDDSMSSSLLPGEKPRTKKDWGQTLYKKPGPPTPSKNGGRLSFQGNEVHPRDALRELNENRHAEGRATTTPNRLRALFTRSSTASTSSNRGHDNSENVSTPARGKRRSIFRR